VEVTGSAAVGSDMLFSAKESIDNTERATIALVLLILLLVYRAPGLVLVPLTAIVASTILAMDLVAVLASWSPQLDWLDFKIFKTTRIFIVVILFGAGTDYCLFLIARYREELERGLTPADAIARALGKVGSALAGSALTTIVGLGMMVFADFGKFRNSGPAIALCLTVALVACVTLAPALLRAMGTWVFWPWKPRAKEPRPAEMFGKGGRHPISHGKAESNTQLPRAGPPFQSASGAPGLFAGFWSWLSRAVLARPGLILVTAVLGLAPLAYAGLSVPLTYDLLSELQADRPSVRGTRLVQQHFGPSEIDPVTLLAHVPHAELDSREGRHQIALLTKELYDFTYVDSAGQTVQPVRSVRSLAEPLGNPPGSFNLFSRAVRDKIFVLKNPQTKRYYCSETPPYDGKVARFDLVFQYAPFSSESIRLLDSIEEFLEAKAESPTSHWHGARFLFTGTTAGIRDLETVTHSDQIRIQVLVVLAVFGVLLLILRRPGICVYLILSVLFGYFVTIGATELFFGWYYGSTYHGLDWKVPIFLFVILVAVGEDYNIYLVTRVFEEQRRRGTEDGLQTALVRTGGIITSCGVIMAGTFASMMTGTLRAMHELGFALSLGVLLDTFVIRTVLVPAFLVLLARWRGDGNREVESK